MPWIKSPQSAPEFTDGNTLIKGIDVIWVFALCLAAAIAATTGAILIGFGIEASGLWPDFETTIEDEWVFFTIVAISSTSALIIVHAFFVVRRSITWRELGFKKFQPPLLAIVLLLILGYLGFEIGTDTGLETSSQPILPADITPVSIIATLFIYGPGIAIADEVISRGLVYRWMRQYLTMAFGIFASATLYSFLNFYFLDPGGIVGIKATFWTWVYASLAAFLYERSGSLWLSIILSIGTAWVFVLVTMFKISG